MACAGCGESVAAGARFCSVCGRSVGMQSVVPPPPAAVAQRSRICFGRLVRPREGRMVAGVCRGFADNLGWDVTIIRLVLLLSVIFGVGVPLVAYAIAWVVMPNGQYGLPARSGMGAGSMGV